MARRSDIRKCCADPIAAKAELDIADAYCAHGDMTNAVRHLRAAAKSAAEGTDEAPQFGATGFVQV